MVGKSTGGNAEIGSSKYPSKPIMITPAISNEVAIGRRMNGSEMFKGKEAVVLVTASAAATRWPTWARLSGLGWGIRRGWLHERAGLQAILAVHDDLLAGLQ